MLMKPNSSMNTPKFQFDMLFGAKETGDFGLYRVVGDAPWEPTLTGIWGVGEECGERDEHANLCDRHKFRLDGIKQCWWTAVGTEYWTRRLRQTRRHDAYQFLVFVSPIWVCSAFLTPESTARAPERSSDGLQISQLLRKGPMVLKLWGMQRTVTALRRSTSIFSTWFERWVYCESPETRPLLDIASSVGRTCGSS